MTAVLTRSNYMETFSVFRRPENCPSVSDVVLISGSRLFHTNGPARTFFIKEIKWKQSKFRASDASCAWQCCVLQIHACMYVCMYVCV